MHEFVGLGPAPDDATRGRGVRDRETPKDSGLGDRKRFGVASTGEDVIWRIPPDRVENTTGDPDPSDRT